MKADLFSFLLFPRWRAREGWRCLPPREVSRLSPLAWRCSTCWGSGACSQCGRAEKAERALQARAQAGVGEGDGQRDKCALGRPLGEERTFASRAEGPGVAERRPCVTSGRELRSLAPAFGPSPVVRPDPHLAQVLTLLGFHSPLDEALVAAACPPPQLSLCTPGTGEAGPGAGRSPADPVLPAGAPQSSNPSRPPPIPQV